MKCTSRCVGSEAASVVLGGSLRNLNADGVWWDSFPGEYKLPQSPGRLLEDKNSSGGKYRHNYKIKML